MLKVDPKKLGARVRRRRKAMDLSQTQLAELVGMKQQGIGSIEKGEVERPGKLKELSAALSTSDDWLLYEIGDEVVVSPLRDVKMSVSIVGYVGAGGMVERAPDDVPSTYPLPFPVPGGLVALVAGDMLSPAYEPGDIILVKEAHERQIGNFYNQRVVALTKDGSQFLSTIAPSTGRGVNLVRLNAATIENVEVVSIREIHPPIPPLRLGDRAASSRERRSRDRRQPAA